MEEQRSTIRVASSFPLGAITTLVFYILKWCKVEPVMNWSGWIMHLPLIISVALPFVVVLVVFAASLIIGAIKNRRY